MEIQDEDRICFKSHYFLDDESARLLSEQITRARSRTNKEKARLLLLRADTLVDRGYISQREKVGKFFVTHWGYLSGVGYKRITPIKNFTIFHHVARTSDSTLLAWVHSSVWDSQLFEYSKLVMCPGTRCSRY